jgi:hypothetical protein
MTRLADPEMQAILINAPVPLPKESPSTFDAHTMLLSVDAEWDTRIQTRPLLSVQFAAYVAGSLVSRMYDPPASRLTCTTLLDLILRFLSDIGLPPSIRTVKGKRKCSIVLLSHYAAAEIGMIADHFQHLFIQPIGQKGHHASLPVEVRDNVAFRVSILDTFAFFNYGLAKMGEAVGLLKIDVGPKEDLAALKIKNPALYHAYGVRDAEIAVAMFCKLRVYVWEKWGIDVLKKKTLPAVGKEVFQRHFLSMPPAPVKTVNLVRPVKERDGSWSQKLQQVACYGGPEDRRLMAARCYHGGWGEVFAFGLQRGDFVEHDVTSLYPSAGIMQPLPNVNTRWREFHDSLPPLTGLEGFGVVDFRFPPEMMFPCLPVVEPGKERMLYPRAGTSYCTIAEMRQAIATGAVLRNAHVFAFTPGPSELDHDVGRYMRVLMAEKRGHPRKSAEYEVAKLLMNSLVGKFAERRHANYLVDFERKSRQHGFGGAAQIIAASVTLRDSLRGLPKVGSLFMPEQATLILGLARALMADFVGRGPILISTDSVIIEKAKSMSGSSLDALHLVDSGLTEDVEADAVFAIRTRLYVLLQRADNVRLPKDLAAPYAQDQHWAVVKIARHGLPVVKEALAEAVLKSLRAGHLVDEPLPRKQLLGANAAIRAGLDLNEEVISEQRPLFGWDRKRVLVKPRVNPWRSWTATRPYQSVARLNAAQQQKLVVSANRRRERRFQARKLRDEALRLIASGMPVRKVSRTLGIPRSTVQDLKKKLWTPMTDFLATEKIMVPPDDDEGGSEGGAL